jgi:diketogulonate reductase-like aldo/keto reductase
VSDPAPLTLQSRRRLNQGPEMPVLGLGVWQAGPGEATRRAVRWALEAGIRLIDTATLYGNETEVGEAVRASGIPRDEIFVTSKLWWDAQGYEPATRACRASQERLGLGPIDLYLIHWPRADPPQLRRDSWRALERLQRDGVCRAVGVSNYTVRHLEELTDGFDLVPAVNQVEFHPLLFQRPLLEYCRSHGIHLEAYSPLGHGRLLTVPEVVEIARTAGRTPAQVLIRWGLQHGVIEIPKSSRKEGIVENVGALGFTLDDGAMHRLDTLKAGIRTTMDPNEMV